MELGLGLTKLIPPAVYICGLLVIFLTLIYKIEVGIFFLVPLFPLQNILDLIHNYPFGKDFVDILILALLVRWVLNRLPTKGPTFLKTPLNLPLLLLISWTFLELWRGSFYLGTGMPINLRDWRFVHWKNFMMLPLIYLIVLNNIKNPKHIKCLVLLMTLSILFMDVTFYNNISHRTMTHYDHSLRLTGTFSYLGPNELAAFHAQYAVILVSLFLLDLNKWRSLLFGVTALFSYYSVAFLFSRGGYLATFVAWAFLGLLRDRRILIVLLILILFWESLLPTAVVERIEMTRTEEGYDETIEERLSLWQNAKQSISDNLLIGIGYDVIPFLNFSSSISQQRRASLHNAYLQVITEMGLIGLAIFLLLFGLGIRAGWQLYKTAPEGFEKGLGIGFMACTVALMSANMTGNHWYYLNVAGFYWVFLALVVRSKFIIENDINNVPAPSVTSVVHKRMYKNTNTKKFAEI